MLKNFLILLVILCFSGLQAQEGNSSYKTKKIPITLDTIQLENTSINSNNFKLLDAKDQPIDSSFYQINFAKGTLVLNKNFPVTNDSLTVHYLKFPESLTKEYRIYADSKVVSNEAAQEVCTKWKEKVSRKKTLPLMDSTLRGASPVALLSATTKIRF